jgi:hypothetical protein
MSSCLAKRKKWFSMESESKFIGPIIGPSSSWTGWTRIEHFLNTCESTWTPMSEWERPLTCVSGHECPKSEWGQPLNIHWVCMNANEWVLNTSWTPIECAWMPLSHYWMQLTMVWPWESAHLCQNWTLSEHLWVHMNTFESVLNTPWTLGSACEHLWVSTEHSLDACERAWMPMSEWEHPLNTHQFGFWDLL